MPFSFLRFSPLLLLVVACARTPHASADLANKYHDATIRQIGTAQDERNTAALLPFLSNANPTYRREAALAFASVQAPAAVPGLLPLLGDADPSVRRAAAYALGQTSDSTAVDALVACLLKENDGLVRRYVQEALGRTVTRRSLPELWRVEIANDTARAAALAWGLSRAALRGISSPESIRRAVQVLDLPKLPTHGRLAAVTSLARTSGHDADLARMATPTLLRVVVKDRSYAVRATAATALGKIASLAPTKVDSVAKAVAGPATVLARLAVKDHDYRVRLSAVRALPFGSGAYSSSRAAVFYVLSHDQAPVALTAAEWLLAHAKGESGPAMAALADGNKQASLRVRAALFQAAVRYASPAARPSLSETVRKRYAMVASEYEMSFLLQALGEDPAAFDFVRAKAFQPGQLPVLMGAALEALLTMRRKADFPAARQADFLAAIRQALASGEVAQFATVAAAFSDPHVYPEAKPADLAALHQAQAKLELPCEIEAWQALQQALDKLYKVPKPTPPLISTALQHPIDWAVVQRVSLHQQVRLRTTKGLILLELKPDEAPGSVASFVTFISQHSYK